MIYGMHTPDFFGKSLFQNFIRTLFAQKILRYHNNGLLKFDENITGIEKDIQLILGKSATVFYR
jgi:glycerol-3-phosphate O-acyltransferase